jgi:hypothetical protein
MIRIALRDQEVRQLDTILRTSDDPALRQSVIDGPAKQRLDRVNWNPIERFWKLLRRRATHNRLFGTTTDLRRSLRSSLSYFQTVRQRGLTLVNRPVKKRTASTGL